VGSARREMLDHVLVLDEDHPRRLVREYRQYFNEARPHQGIGQRAPGGQALAADVTKPIVATPVLGGLYRDYQRAA
jgi:putative transposase